MRTTVLTILSLLTAQMSWSEPVTIRFIDMRSGELTPVRVELLDEHKQPVVASNAIPISSDCALAPLPAWLAQPMKTSLFNPFSGTDQHYVDGVGRYELAAGRYQLRVFKGSEFKVLARELTVSKERNAFYIEMERWYEETDAAWASSDVHLHIGRLSASRDTDIAKWMAAEDIDIANLLQMGALSHFAAAPQYSFDTVGGRNTLLIPGQEHPRTHLLGHALSLGGIRAVDERAAYILYNKTFDAVRSTGGINGFAHWGAGPSRNGIALNAHHGNVEILEILGVGALYVDTWYELLNLGFEIAAVAGTDFPCLAGVPGRERTYIRTATTPSRSGMVESLRRGQSFVTNGPILKLYVEGESIGAKLELSTLDDLHVRGELHYDSDRDAVEVMELVQNGDVIRAWNVPTTQGTFMFDEVVSLDASGWLALRATGLKLGETPSRSFPAWMNAGFSKWMNGASADEIDSLIESGQQRRSYAHTSPIYVRSQEHPMPTGNISSWLTRLDQLAQMLDQQNFALIWDWLPYSDGVDEGHLRKNASQLQEQIRKARADFMQRGKSP